MTLEWKWGKPLLNSYSNAPQKGYVEIQPDAGTPYRRLNFTDIGDIVNCTFCFTRQDYVQFMSWYKYEMRQGTIPFLMYDCRYDIKRMARLVGEVPNYMPNSNRFNVSLSIYFMPDIIYKEYDLATNENDLLIINDEDTLSVDIELRI